MITYLIYKDEKIPVRVSYYAIKHFTLETKKPIEAIEEDISLLEPLLWYSMMAGYKAEGAVNPHEREEMETILDECYNQFTLCFGSFFLEQSQKSQQGQELPQME